VNGLNAFPRSAPGAFHREFDLIDHKFEVVIFSFGSVPVLHIDYLSERIAATSLG
jgi:hypothetical protein